MPLRVSWPQIESTVQKIAVQRTLDGVNVSALAAAKEIGFVGRDESRVWLNENGEAFFKARFVLEDNEEVRESISSTLKGLPLINAFCETLWPIGEVPKTGAVRLIQRLEQEPDEESAKRWLDIMNRGRLITYNKSKPNVDVHYNPRGLREPDSPEREQQTSHLLDPSRPYGNLLAFRSLLRGSREWIRWYEPHLPPKALEVLYREIESGQVGEIRLLSGPTNVDVDLKREFRRFKKEMKDSRGIGSIWRVLSSSEAFKRHDRFFITRDFARNLPPLNSILANSSGEILPSELSIGEFDEWWSFGTPLEEFDES